MINPFDFANPVATKDMFIGRETELKDIFFYLDHAKGAPRSINLALLGDRAAGKTSLLNIIELESRNRGLIPVRVNLNEGDAASSIGFWFKLFDAIFTTLVETSTVNGTGFIFGGINGRTYGVYSDIVATYVIPDDKTFCPFLFPLHYARAMSANNHSVLVPEQILERDLRKLSREAGCLVVLLIDECNVLSANKTLLEMVRNTFMNLPGYMLVFTGTPSLFPVMDEVFSPIVRQFKRINVAPFSTPQETLEAVETPLRRIGMEGLFLEMPRHLLERLPRDLWHYFDEQLQDLHDVTGGRPYEIQLVCHFMFRRIQAGKAEKMRLTYEVLADVLEELGGASNLDQRPVIAAVLRLSEDRLDALKVLVMVQEGVGVAATVAAARLTGLTEQSCAHVCEAFDELRSHGILGVKGEVPQFLGDDFDRIFCKYAARNKGIALAFGGVSPGELLEDFIRSIATREFHLSSEEGIYRVTELFPLFRGHLVREAATASEALALLAECSDSLGLPQLIRGTPSALRELYRFCIQHEAALHHGLHLLRLEFEADSYRWESAFIHTADSRGQPAYDTLLSALRQLEMRAPSDGARVVIRSVRIAPCNVSELVEAARTTELGAGRHVIAEVHAEQARYVFLNKKEREVAIAHARRAASFGDSLDTGDASNMAFILLTAGLYSEARELLQSRVGRPDFTGLTAYNYGIASLCCREIGDALLGFRRVRDDIQGEEERDVLVLLIPKLREGQVALEEMWLSAQSEENAGERVTFQSAVASAIACAEALAR